MALWHKKKQIILEASKKDDAPYKDYIPQIIALALLFTFVGTVVALFWINICTNNFLDKDKDTDFKKGWFDLLKNTLVLLSTALTTVIGYYFGQREGSIKSEQAVQESKSKEQEAVQLAQTIYENRNRSAKEGILIGNDSPDETTPSADLDEGIIIP